MFGGTQGFNSFRPENIKPNPYVPNVIVTKFSLLGKEVKVGDKVFEKVLLTKPVMETKNVKIGESLVGACYKDEKTILQWFFAFCRDGEI